MIRPERAVDFTGKRSSWQRTIRHVGALPDPVIAATLIVAITANAFSTDEEKALTCGMNGYLTKPVNIQQITEGLSTVLKEQPNEP